MRADGDPRLFHGVYTGQRVRLKGYLRSSSSLDLSSAVTTMKIKAIVPLSARPKAAPQVTGALSGPGCPPAHPPRCAHGRL